MSTYTEEIFEALESLKFLIILPVAVLKIVAIYAHIRPVKGVCVAKIRSEKDYRETCFEPDSFLSCSVATGELLVLKYRRAYVQVFSMNDLGFLRSWGTSGSGPGCLRRPSGICVDETTGHVIVADTGNHRLQVFHLNGKFIRIIGGGKGSHSRGRRLRHPYGVSVDSEARLIYASENSNHRISVFSLDDGSFVRCFGRRGIGDDQFSHPMGLHFDEERKLLFIADSGNYRVKVVRSDGSLVRMLGVGSHGNGDDQLRGPVDVTVDSLGEVFIADTHSHRIKVFSLSTGQYLRNISSGGLSGDRHLNYPTGLWLDRFACRLFACDVWERYVEVQVFE